MKKYSYSFQFQESALNLINQAKGFSITVYFSKTQPEGGKLLFKVDIPVLHGFIVIEFSALGKTFYRGFIAV